MSIGVLFLILLHAAPLVLGQNDTQLLDDEPPGENFAPSPSLSTSSSFYDDFSPGQPSAPTAEPSSSEPPPSLASTTLAPNPDPIDTSEAPPPPPPESNPPEPEPEPEPELEQPVEPLPVIAPETNKLDRAEYSEPEYADVISRNSGGYGTKPPALPKFTQRTTTTTTTTPAPELIEMQDYIPPPVSSSQLKIPKFDLPRVRAMTAPGGGGYVNRPPYKEAYRERPWDRETGYTDNKIPFARAKPERGYMHDSPSSGFRLDEEEDDEDDEDDDDDESLKSGDNKKSKPKKKKDKSSGGGRGKNKKKDKKGKGKDKGKDSKATTKAIMLGITLATVFAAMLIIFILTFLLMDRIVALA